MHPWLMKELADSFVKLFLTIKKNGQDSWGLEKSKCPFYPWGRQEDTGEQDCSLDVWEGNGANSPGNQFQSVQEGG